MWAWKLAYDFSEDKISTDVIVDQRQVREVLENKHETL